MNHIERLLRTTDDPLKVKRALLEAAAFMLDSKDAQRMIRMYNDSSVSSNADADLIVDCLPVSHYFRDYSVVDSPIQSQNNLDRARETFLKTQSIKFQRLLARSVLHSWIPIMATAEIDVLFRPFFEIPPHRLQGLQELSAALQPSLVKQTLDVLVDLIRDLLIQKLTVKDAIHDCVKVDEEGSSRDDDYRRIADLVSKACRLGQANVLVDVWCQRLIQDPIPNWNAWNCILSNLNVTELELVSYELISRLSLQNFPPTTLDNAKSDDDAVRLLTNLFGKSLHARESSAVYVFTKSFIFTKILSLSGLKLLIRLYNEFEAPSEMSILSAIKRISETWSTPSFVKHATFQRRQYITWSLLLCLRYVDEAHLRDSDIEQWVMSGLQRSLENVSENDRMLAMVLAECFFAKVNPHVPLTFEIKETAHVNFLRGLFSNETSDNAVIVTQPDLLSLNELQVSETHEEQGYEMDPDELVDDNAQLPETNVGVLSDDDIELEPLQPTEDSETAFPMTKKKPKYLKDCIKLLKDGENPDSIETGLHNIEDLIRNAEILQLEEMYQDVGSMLVSLKDGFDIEGFLKMRQSSIIALGLRLPRQMAKLLTDYLGKKDLNISEKLDIMNCIAVIAVQLSSTVVKTSAVSTAHNFVYRNSLAEFGPDFFYPLLSRLEALERKTRTSKETFLETLMKAQLINSMCIILEASANTPPCRAMGRQFFDTISRISYKAEDKSVRVALLQGYLSVFYIIPCSNMILDDYSSDDLATLIEQISDIVSWETNPEAQKKAALLIAAIVKNMPN
ncbi:TEL2, telomere maintenance protein 2 [Chytridiales sp. JEL 0842]|nr:TEL2, telomere maintenance protein 2 [Chytridiales sp. JEL 0842]